MLIFINR